MSNQLPQSGHFAGVRNEQIPVFLLISILISGVSTFMLYPLLTFRLLDMGLNLTEVGVVLGALSGTGKILAYLIGTINSRVGSKLTACIGLILRTVGIAVFFFQVNTFIYVVFAALASLGSTATALGIKTELMRLSHSRKYITLRSMAINSGAIVGPALGAAFHYFFHFNTILIVSILAYVFLALLLAILPFSQPEAQATSMENTSDGKGKDSFLLIAAIAGIYWIIYSQWSIIVPLMSENVFGVKEASNGIYIGNAVIVLCLQYPLLVLALKNVEDTSVMLLGFSSFIIAFGVLLPFSSMAQPLLFCLFFSIGELLVSPTIDSLAAKLAPSHMGLTKVYGMLDSAAGICAIIGSSLGGALIERWHSLQGSVIVCVPVAALSLIFISVIKRRVKSI
ncbi:MFS transporter [Corynebacterium sp. sy039]|uniref:MFS transporter n=1 Tax=Corynebacterium sp. sy039 TaxID=2599641 RepID=UPI0011B75D9B|nr:MFS transporter [Corynebacterium sp. sy039]QDZ41828.1 MFS transporter [Corynebacterium sp. sy039]